MTMEYGNTLQVVTTLVVKQAHYSSACNNVYLVASWRAAYDGQTKQWQPAERQ